MIKSGKITIQVGDYVYLLCRKANGYPKILEYGVPYKVKRKDGDYITIIIDDRPGFVKTQHKIHKTFLINKSEYRNIMIDEILKK